MNLYECDGIRRCAYLKARFTTKHTHTHTHTHIYSFFGGEGNDANATTKSSVENFKCPSSEKLACINEHACGAKYWNSHLSHVRWVFCRAGTTSLISQLPLMSARLVHKFFFTPLITTDINYIFFSIISMSGEYHLSQK